MSREDIFAILLKARNNGHAYFSVCSDMYLENLTDALNAISIVIKDSAFQDIIDHKLKLQSTEIDIKQCIQALCEITILSYFAKHYPSSFQYEPKLIVGSKKNPEMSFKIDDISVSIEAKCATYENREQLSDNNLHVHSHMVPDKTTVKATLDLFNEVAKLGKYEGAQKMKNMNNNLKDYLTGANEKFNLASTDKDVNCLFVCCDDPNDLDIWVGYLYGYQGLFQNTKVFKPCEYELVDVLMLTNLYNKHKNPLAIGDVNVFDLDTTFIVCFPNPRPKVTKAEAIIKLLTQIPNQTDAVCKTQVPGDAPQDIKDTTRISYFVCTNEEYQNYFINYKNPLKKI